MRTLLKSSVIAAFVGSLLLAFGCEQTPLTPGENFSIHVTASPTNVAVDSTNHPPPERPAMSTIVATILSDMGVPQKGYTVYFTTSSGVLDSNSQPVKTDSSGRALDILRVGAQDQTAITVTATATPLSGTVSVTQNGACDAAVAPVARITGMPAGDVRGAADSDVTVSPLGSTSTDTAPGTIVEYDWDCGNDTTETGATPTCTYHVGAAGSADVIYTIKLIVKDDGCCGLGLACQKSSTQATASVTVGIAP